MKDARNIEDANLVETKAFPAADAAAYTDPLDLVELSGGAENFEVVISHPALPALANTKTATLFLQESAEANANFANVGFSFVSTGVDEDGAAAKSARFRPASGTKRYVRLGVAVEASGGDNTGVSATLKGKF